MQNTPLQNPWHIIKSDEDEDASHHARKKTITTRKPQTNAHQSPLIKEVEDEDTHLGMQNTPPQNPQHIIESDEDDNALCHAKKDVNAKKSSKPGESSCYESSHHESDKDEDPHASASPPQETHKNSHKR